MKFHFVEVFETVAKFTFPSPGSGLKQPGEKTLPPCRNKPLHP
jgi:hypothetical protein